MVGMVGLDFETYGAVSLPDHGLHRYVSDPSFTVLIGSVCATVNNKIERKRWDFAHDRVESTRELEAVIGSAAIVAHNAPFEEAVLHRLGLHYPPSRFIDSAVVARAAGASGHLEGAAPQLLNVDKVESGKHLMKLFSMPGEQQEKNGNGLFDYQVVRDHWSEWLEYGDYCDVDAELGLRIVEECMRWLTSDELYYQGLTMQMNRLGWPVDLPLVEEMHRRYQENQEQAEFAFMSAYLDSAINLRSLKQMKEWCAKRGINATSFDEKHVASLLTRIEAKVATMPPFDPKAVDYKEVLHLLRTKQVLGGSSLKKLKVILDTVVTDDQGVARLRDQYVHCGAGQTLRTSGRSVQMQNLKQLRVIADVDELKDPDVMWDNGKMAENLRQVFTSSDKDGRLIVGDFKSIESRALAFMAEEAWKVNAYRQELDVYQELADKFNNTRKFGKVGELSCGYGAGGPAVQAFADKMGIELSEGEANGLVNDWRAACPRTIEFWDQLNDMLHKVLEPGRPAQSLIVGGGLKIIFRPGLTPISLLNQHPKAQTIEMAVESNVGKVVMKRVFHGCYLRGRNVAYYKPSDRKTGDLWRNTFIDQKTKQLRFYELYGGKLAGILTQSLCREIFMSVLAQVDVWSRGHRNVDVVGQFHDEIVVDWTTGVAVVTEQQACNDLRRIMSKAPAWLPSFPLSAEIKSAHRYIK